MVALRYAVFGVAGASYRFSWTLGQLVYEGSKDVVTYASIVVVTLAVVHQAAHQRAALRAARLETALQEARLQQLTARLRPHFLLNTLNTVSACMYEDVAAADRILDRLGRLLNRGLREDPRELVPLAEELATTELYLDIMRERLGDRLVVEIDVPRGLHDVPVPPFLLQPLVENAVVHGIARREAGGRLRIVVRRREGMLQLEIHNDGAPPAASAEGIGLGATRERLELLYGAPATLELSETAAGAVVRIGLPGGDEGKPA
jgi:LytS/YehU family sensor histidine kinase